MAKYSNLGLQLGQEVPPGCSYTCLTTSHYDSQPLVLGLEIEREREREREVSYLFHFQTINKKTPKRTKTKFFFKKTGRMRDVHTIKSYRKSEEEQITKKNNCATCSIEIEKRF